MAEGKVAVIAGGYQSREEAEAGLESVRILHSVENLGTYDAAIVEKKPGGKIDIVKKTAVTTHHGAESGMAVGAVIGLVFPPAIIATGAVGAGVGSITEHLHKGMKSKDIKEIGSALDEGQAALIVVVDAAKGRRVAEVMAKAFKVVVAEVEMAVKNLDKALTQALEERRNAASEESG